MAAGPLLNSKWIELYSKLGFDILTYKTVRSRKWAAHPHPNHVFVDVADVISIPNDETLVAYMDPFSEIASVTMVNSYGMPSAAPKEWQSDVTRAKQVLTPGQMLVVSIVGTSSDDSSLDDLAFDFAHCAERALSAGADAIELNFSCPNVKGEEGQIYKNPESSALIAKKTRELVGSGANLFLKIGYLNDDETLSFVRATVEHVDAYSAINTQPIRVVNNNRLPALPGREVGGLCGRGLHNLAVQAVENLSNVRKNYGFSYSIIGIGGILTIEDARRMLNAGADAVESATGAMVNPFLAQELQLGLNL